MTKPKEMINNDYWYEKILVRSKAEMREKRSRKTEDEKDEERASLRERMRKLREKKITHRDIRRR